MKTKLLLLILFPFVLLSCNKAKKVHSSTPEEWAKVANDFPKDTTINQDIWYNADYGYCLQTWVKTRNQQIHMAQHKKFEAWIVGDTYAPYNKEIAGTFDYIKRNKLSEYNKAKIFVDSLKIAAISIRIKQKLDSIADKKINDSIKLLMQ